MRIKIEEGSAEDCTAVLNVLQKAFAPYTDQLQPPSGVLFETVESLQKKCETNKLLLAKQGNDVVGCLFCTPQRNHPQNLYFGRLAILPTHQGQDIAKLLVTHVETIAQNDGYEKVVLYVRKMLPQNVGFFQSCGYEIYAEGTHEGFTEPTYYKLAKSV